MHSGRLLEPEIKAIVLNHLKENAHISESTSVINEFTIDNYSRRVDLAFANQSYLMAFEIKSEADNLNRLEGQVEKYLEYFDKVIIVAASKHIENILQETPKNVAVWEIFKDGVLVRRRGKIEKINDKEKLIKLMKANELRKLSNQLGFDTEVNNRYASETALKDAPVSALRKATLEFIKKRFLQSHTYFWNHVGNIKVEPQHIDLLSPYKEEREYLREKESNNNALWERMLSKASEDPNLTKLAQRKKEPVFGHVPKEIEHLLTA